jgi:hypothetical protein
MMGSGIWSVREEFYDAISIDELLGTSEGAVMFMGVEHIFLLFVKACKRWTVLRIYSIEEGSDFNW